MKIHKTLSLNSDVVDMLNKEKNQSLFIENLIRSHFTGLSNASSVASEDDLDREMVILINKKRDLEEQISINAEKEVSDNIEALRKSARADWLLKLTVEERKKVNQAILNKEVESSFDYYEKFVEARPF